MGADKDFPEDVKKTLLEEWDAKLVEYKIPDRATGWGGKEVSR